MAERPIGIENRRSVRVYASIPIVMSVGRNPPEHGVTSVVNRHGASVLSPIEHAEGTIIEIQNELTSRVVRCRAVWVGGMDPGGVQKLGVEFVDDAPTFWGDIYEERLALASNGGGQKP